MNIRKQVDKTHYNFGRYMSKWRWISVWHQLDEVQKLQPETVLEIGPGPGLFKTVSTHFGINVETLDFDPELEPDHVGSITDIPLDDARFDVVCAFQVLEHLPYDLSLKAMAEMARVTRRYVVISLPDARTVWRYRFHIPKISTFDFLLPRPQLRAPQHKFEGEHYWEINTKGYALNKVTADLSEIIPLRNTYRVTENPYHRFFVFERR